jgi:hypothetical protein
MYLYNVHILVYRRGESGIASAWADVVFAPTEHIAACDVIARMKILLQQNDVDPSTMRFIPVLVKPISDTLLTMAYYAAQQRMAQLITDAGIGIANREDFKACPICGEQHTYMDCPEYIFPDLDAVTSETETAPITFRTVDMA